MIDPVSGDAMHCFKWVLDLYGFVAVLRYALARPVGEYVLQWVQNYPDMFPRLLSYCVRAIEALTDPVFHTISEFLPPPTPLKLAIAFTALPVVIAAVSSIVKRKSLMLEYSPSTINLFAASVFLIVYGLDSLLWSESYLYVATGWVVLMFLLNLTSFSFFSGVIRNEVRLTLSITMIIVAILGTLSLFINIEAAADDSGPPFAAFTEGAMILLSGVWLFCVTLYQRLVVPSLKRVLR